MLERSHKVWNYCFIGICVLEKPKMWRRMCLVFCSFGVLWWSEIHFWSVPSRGNERTVLCKICFKKSRWRRCWLPSTCRQFMFIISIENERVGESCVITTKEWEGMHNSQKSKDFPFSTVLRNLWEILDWSWKWKSSSRLSAKHVSLIIGESSNILLYYFSTQKECRTIPLMCNQCF